MRRLGRANGFKHTSATLTTRDNETTMSKTADSVLASNEDNSEQWSATEDSRVVAARGGESGTGDRTATNTGGAMVQRMVVISIAVTLDKMRGEMGSRATDELIELLHSENFDLEMFKNMIKSWEDCQVITANVIEQCKSS